jgi:hypothetical protein
MTEGTCSICWTELDGRLTTTPCRHTFHAECLAEWGTRDLLKNPHASCPLCRGKIDVPRIPTAFITTPEGQYAVTISRLMQMAEVLPSSEQRAIGREFANWLKTYPLRVRKKSWLDLSGQPVSLVDGDFHDRDHGGSIEILVNDRTHAHIHYVESLLVLVDGLPTIHVPTRLGLVRENELVCKRCIFIKTVENSLAPYAKVAMWLFCNEPTVVGTFRDTGFALSVPPPLH